MDSAESEFSESEYGWGNASTYYDADYCDNADSGPSLFRFILLGVLAGLIALFGIVANGAVIRVLLKPSMRCPTAYILIALAVVDIAALACNLFMSTMEVWAEFMRWQWLHNLWLTFIVVMFALSHAASLAGVYTALLAAFERALAALCPDIGRRLCRTAFALAGVALAALLSLALGAPKLLEVAVRRAESCAEGDWHAYRLELGALAHTPVYHLLQQVLGNPLHNLWPYLLMALMLALMAIGLLAGRRRAFDRAADAAAGYNYKSRQYLRMVAGVAALFLPLYLPQVALVLMEWVHVDRLHSNADAYGTAADITNMLLLIYVAAKPLVYVALSPMFRRVLLNRGETHEVAMVDMRMGEKAAHPERQGGDAVDEKTRLHNV